MQALNAASVWHFVDGEAAGAPARGMSWQEFWSRDTSIYVNERHRQVHYADVAADIIALVPGKAAGVLDFGCGEALSADRVAQACGRLYLCDSSPLVRQRLTARHADRASVSVLAPEGLATLPDGGLDLIVVNSVLQYLSADELAVLLDRFAGLLAPGGTLVLADVVPPDVGPLADAAALLRYAAAKGFLLAALAGLVRTFFSDYRKKRAALGLSHYSQSQILARLADHGLVGRRRATNLGHNPNRMTILAQRAAPDQGSA